MIRSPILALPFALFAADAGAHTLAEATTPADGTAVAAVPTLAMRFDDPVQVIAVTLSSEGAEVGIERETDTVPATEFRAVPAKALAPGPYRLEWRGMSADGHPVRGGFGFTVTE